MRREWKHGHHGYELFASALLVVTLGKGIVSQIRANERHHINLAIVKPLDPGGPIFLPFESPPC